MFRKLFKLASIGLLLVSTAIAQQPGQPSVNRLQQIISYLASDALEGRRTGTPGANDAAHYIAGEFSLLGLRPAIQMAGAARTRGEIRARYLQPFPYVSKAELGKNNLLFVNPGRADDAAQFAVGEDWMPLGFSTNAEVKAAEMVFAGYGITSAELKYDDYAVSNAKDRVAIVFAGTPDADNPHGQFQQAGQIRFKAAAARAAGARALLIIADEEKLKDDRLARLSYDNAGEAGIPIVVISQKLAKKILNTELDDLVKAADARTAAGNALRDPITGAKLNLNVNVNRIESPSFNVVGILPGTDPKLKNEAIVIGAHYDHLGRGGEGSLAPREGEIHHCTDDNASGVAGLIELARMLSTQNPKPRRTIVFIAFSGEEEGLIGSSYYVNHSVVPLANTIAMINMDMIGRLKDNKIIIGGVGTSSEWRQMVTNEDLESQTIALAELAKPDRMPGKVTMVMGSDSRAASAIVHTQLFDLTLNEDGFGPSDHSSFYSK